MYVLLRAIAGIALRWYYRDIHVEGLDRIPRRRPLLFVVNHPNAFVDALLVGWVDPAARVDHREEHALLKSDRRRAAAFRGRLPLHRAKDEGLASAPTHAAIAERSRQCIARSAAAERC